MLIEVFCIIFSQLQKEEFLVYKNKYQNMDENNNKRVETDYIVLEEYITITPVETIKIEFFYRKER